MTRCRRADAWGVGPSLPGIFTSPFLLSVCFGPVYRYRWRVSPLPAGVPAAFVVHRTRIGKAAVAGFSVSGAPYNFVLQMRRQEG
jgi:hypothetical protein